MVSVVKASHKDEYVTQFDPGHDVTPDAPSDDLVAVVFRMKNMTKKTLEIYQPHLENTSLTDQEEHSYESKYNDCLDTVPKVLRASA